MNMKQISLAGKTIPLKFASDYSVSVNPLGDGVLDENGEKRPKQSFPFRLVMDLCDRVYLLPLIPCAEHEDAVEKPAYTVEDIVEAASGVEAKRQQIEAYHARMRAKYFNEKTLLPIWCDVLWDQTFDLFFDGFNEMLAKRGEHLYSVEDFPEDTTTYDRLSPEEVSELVAMAV